METPILDKYSLHPIGGYCTCFSNPYGVCMICSAIKAQKARWAALNEIELKKAEKEYESIKEYDYDRGGR